MQKRPPKPLGRRVRCLEARPVSTMAECPELATLNATDGVLHYRGLTRLLRESLTHILKEERVLVTEAQHAGDEVTAQVLIAMMQFQEEALWKLRTSLRRTAFEEQYLNGEAASTEAALFDQRWIMRCPACWTPSGNRRTG